MAYTDATVIGLSRGKNVLLLLGSLAFVAGGAWLLSLDPEQIRQHPLFASPLLYRIVGWVSIAFFGLCAVVSAKQLIDGKPGLVLHAGGLVDNSSGVSVGAVPWSDVAGLSVYRMGGQKFMVVLVHDDDKYAGIGNAMQQAARRANIGMCKSPVTITSNSLDVGFDRLQELFETYFDRYGAPRP